MAEKVLKIRLVANSEGLAELIKQTDSLGKAIDNSSKKVGLEARLTEELRRLQEKLANEKGVLAQKIQSANDLLDKGIQNQGLAWYNAQRALTSYNKATEGTRTAITALQEALAKLQAQQKYFFSNALQSTPLFKPNSDYGIALKDGMTAAGMKALRDKAAAEQALRDQSLARFNSYLSEQEKRLAASIEKQKAIQIHGIDSIEAKRVQALENERRLQLKLQQDLQSIRDKISSGGLTSNAANVETGKVLQNYRRAVLEANKALLEQEQAHERARASTQNLATRILEIIGIYRAYNFILNSASNAIKAIPNIGIQLESTKAVLEVTEGSTNGMVVTLQALTKEADRAGLQIQTVRESFRTFSASASLAGESSKDIWTMFTNINTVATALHLTTDQTNHVFLALAQIFNKTKVQSEELVKQLGNLLPGAFASFAAANKDIFTSTADLVAKMKAGVVTAHDTVLKFTDYLAGRFDLAFESASKGLNASINRMKNSWTLLGEAIYNTTSGGLITATKVLGGLANIIKADVQGLNILGGTVKTVLIAGMSTAVVYVGALVAKFVETASAAIKAKGAVELFKVAVNTITVPTAFGALITGLGIIASKFYEVRTARLAALEETEQLSDKLKQIQERAKLKPEDRKKFDIDHAEGVVKAEERLNQLYGDREKLFQQLQKFYGERRQNEILSNADLKRLDEGIIKAKTLVKEARSTAKLDLEKGNLSEPVELLSQVESAKLTLDKEYARASGDIAKEATLSKIQYLKQEQAAFDNQAKVLRSSNKKLYVDLATTTSEAEKNSLLEQIASNDKKLAEAQEYTNKYNYIIAHAADKALEAGGTKGPNLSLKNNRLQLADSTRDTRVAVAELENAIQNLDALSTRGLISFQDYFNQKKELILQEIELEKRRATEALQASLRSGDKGNVAKAKDDLRLAEMEKQKKLNDLINSTAASKADFNAKLDEAHAKFLQLNGVAEAFQQKYEAQNKEFVNRLDSEIAAGNTRALQIKNEIALTNQLEGVKERLALVDEKVNAEDIRHTNALNRINILTEQGTMSQLEAFQAQTKENERNLQILNQLIAAKEKEIALVPKSLQATAEYQSLINQLEQLKNQFLETKLAANALTSHIKTTFQQSFSQAFASVITGSATAKDAFKSFIQAILEEMANLLASAIASQFIQLFEQMFSSSGGIGSTFASGLFSGLTSGFSTGGVISNNNIVPFAKGGIPDVGNKMQYFPLANGGIGSLRENNKYEAILPLHRDASGSLGVKANISPLAQSAGNVYNITVHVQSGKDDKPAATGDKVAEAIVRRIAREEAGKMQRNTSYANKNQKFG